MRRYARGLSVFVLFCVAVLTSGASETWANAGGEGPSSALGALAEGGLVVTGSPFESEQVAAARLARLASSGAVVAREVSRTKFEHLDRTQASTLASSTFPSLVNEPAGGLPPMPGQHVTRYLTDYAAAVTLGHGEKGIVESVTPIAAKTPHGARVPLNLALTPAGSAFVPRSTLVNVSIPKQLDNGVSLPSVGVSLTPVGASGTPLSGAEGVIDGATVLYANSETDTDALAKPTAGGVEADTLLRSVESPHTLYYRLGLPRGARLQDRPDGSIAILEGSTTIAEILAPGAQDAAGTPVPVSMSATRNRLTIAVDDPAGRYALPIAVDPEIVVTDSHFAENAPAKTDWEFHASSGNWEGVSNTGDDALSISGNKHTKEEFAYWGYETQGVSHIWELASESSATNKGAGIESLLIVEHSGTVEEKIVLSSEAEKTSEYSKKADKALCPKNSCISSSGTAGNGVRFEETAVTTMEGHAFADSLVKGVVSIAEPSGTRPGTAYNTTSPTLTFEVENSEGKKERETRANALYSADPTWLSEVDGALELIAEDDGIGVSATRLEYETSKGTWERVVEHSYLKEGLCKGVQCYDPKHTEAWTLNPKLPNGEDTIRYRAEEAAPETESSTTSGLATIKVDRAKPQSLRILGLPFGNELSERPYKLTLDATDGEGSTVPSSGIKSIELSVDKHPLTKTGGTGECVVAAGECTATDEFTINGEELGAGHHAIVMIAKDNAGNEARREEQITIRHSTPVPIGPGSVDVESGDFAMGPTDVSLGDGLTVSRNYSSRDTTQGLEGPLGPEWAVSLGTSESLVEMIDGSMLLTDSTGKQTIFAKTETTTYESPPGDGNLKLTLDENTETHKKETFYLENVSEHTKDKFTLQGEQDTQTWVPTRQEGAVATDTVTYAYRTTSAVQEYPLAENSHPNGITRGPEGNLWFVDEATSKIGRSTPTGSIVEYPLPEKSEPVEIVTGPDGNLWFTEQGTNKIGRMTPSGSRVEYSLPANSRPEGITVLGNELWFTEANEIGSITTSGTISQHEVAEHYRQGGAPSQIVAGANGNLWFTYFNKELITEMTPEGNITGDFSTPAGFGIPSHIAPGPEGEQAVWVTSEAKVGKLTMTGEMTPYSLPAGSRPAGITPTDNNTLWFADRGTNKLSKITTAGVISEYSVPEGSSPQSIAAGAEGNLWFTEAASNRIAMTTPAATRIEPTEAVAPIPAGVEGCPQAKLNPGCRVLKFEYAENTTASGEGEEEWGEYKGRLSKVLYEVYNPTTKKMEEPGIPVAEYRYDKLGRLRTEIEPRAKLATTYGYDEEGHLTALTPPGQEPWTFTYGAVQGDAGTGRLLKVTRAQPHAGASEQESAQQLKELREPEKNTQLPGLTGGPVVGANMSVTNGTWVGHPISYSYQWEECESEELCSPIAGATNADYTIGTTSSDHRLRATVTATNGSGTLTATSQTSATISPLTLQGDVGEEGELTNARAVAAGGVEDLLVVSGDHVRKYTESGRYLTEFGSEGEAEGDFKTPTGIAIDANKDAWVTDAGNDRIEEFNSEDKFVRAAGKKGITLGHLEEPNGIAVATNGDVWVADTGNKRVEVFSSEGTALETVHTIPHEVEYPSSIAAGPNGTIWIAGLKSRVIDEFNDKYEFLRKVETVCSNFSSSHEQPRLGVDPDGNLWATISGGAHCPSFDVFNERGEQVATLTPSPEHIGIEPDASDVAVRGTSTWTPDGTLQRWIAPQLGELAATQPGPGTTVEYGVPLSGTGVPAMTSAEVAKWGQEDDPVEATALIPPDSPQEWPAASYKRATIYYVDEEGRTVNISQPSTATYGSITTSEYNEDNDITRTLSADNRATALAAGASSVEVSKLLDTENHYNEPECQNEQPGQVAEPGTRLCETLGPQHEIKYTPNGLHETRESLGRDHEEYFYNQGVPKEKPFSEETFSLLTETSDLALLANREDVEVRTTKNSYAGQKNRGWTLREPTSVTVDPKSEGEPHGLNLTHTTIYNELGQVTETEGAASEHTLPYSKDVTSCSIGAGALKNPSAAVFEAKGHLWVADTGNNRIEEFTAGSGPKCLVSFGEAGSEPGKLNAPQGIAVDSKGNIWVADTGNNRIEEYNSEGKYLAEFGSTGSEKGQLKEPTAIAFDSKGNLWVADTGNNRIQKFNSEGKATSEFGALGSEPGELKGPRGLAIDSEGNIWVADTGNNRIQQFNASGTLLAHFAGEGAGEGQLHAPAGLAFDSTGDLWVADTQNNRIEAFTATGGYVSQTGWLGTGNGQLEEPKAVAFNSEGNMWVADATNNRLDEFVPGANAHDLRTIYYTAEANKEEKACGKQAQWSGLICQTLPAKQPKLDGLSKLPVTTTTYNMWLEPATIEEEFSTTAIRTRKEEYDEAGRMIASEITAKGTSDKTLPKVTLEYNKETGELVKQSNGEGTIKSEYSRLGQLLQYTDASGNTTTYRYGADENDNLLEEVSDGFEETHEGKEQKSYQRYTYEETTKALSKLEDSAAGTFTASYDAEGRMTSETYPNGMCANYAYNAVGEAEAVKYLKTSNCAEKEPTVLFSDSRMASIHGEIRSQTSTLASETYSYDQAGRLTEVQETPTGEDCTVRAYAYDEESNRASLTTSKPSSKCEPGGTVEAHNYDEANRLADPGTTYEAFGNVEKLPATDGEGHELTSTYYADGAVATQTQNGVSHEYKLDPEGRVQETTTGAQKVISHYDGSGEAVAWTSQEEGKKTTRNIPGIDGSLTATQTGSEIELQIHDLQGDTVATISDNTSETKLKHTYNSSEFGAPVGGKAPPKYAWLGGVGVASELASGVITYGATSYVPQTGRALQPESVVPPGLPDGSGGGAPVSFEEEPWMLQGAERGGHEAPGLEAGREHEAFLAAMANKVDPEHKWYAWQAKQVGEKAKKLLVIHDLIGQLSTIFGSAAVGEILKATEEWGLTGGVVEDWIEDFAEKLVGCAAELHRIHDSHGGCLSKYTNFIWEEDPVPEFYENPFVAWCEHMTSDASTVSSCDTLLDQEEYEIYEKKVRNEA
jgi:YD repeat-containing protein